jgi:hypothetical protein
VLLLCRDPEDAGVADTLGAELLEQRIRAARRRDDLTTPEGDPLPLKSSENLG